MKLITIISILCFTACATTHYGNAQSNCSNKKQFVAVKNGQSENQVLSQYGPPAKTTTVKERTYWTYNIVKGGYFLIFGSTKYSDVVVVFQNNVVVDQYVLQQGKSVGIFAYPSAS